MNKWSNSMDFHTSHPRQPGQIKLFPLWIYYGAASLWERERASFDLCIVCPSFSIAFSVLTVSFPNRIMPIRFCLICCSFFGYNKFLFLVFRLGLNFNRSSKLWILYKKNTRSNTEEKWEKPNVSILRSTLFNLKDAHPCIHTHTHTRGSYQ